MKKIIFRLSCLILILQAADLSAASGGVPSQVLVEDWGMYLPQFGTGATDSSGILDKMKWAAFDAAGNAYLVIDCEGQNPDGTQKFFATICKLDPNGTILWKYEYTGSGIGTAENINVDPLGGVHVAFWPEGSGIYLKLDSTGALVSTHTFTTDRQYPYVTCAPDGSAYFIAQTFDANSNLYGSSITGFDPNGQLTFDLNLAGVAIGGNTVDASGNLYIDEASNATPTAYTVASFNKNGGTRFAIPGTGYHNALTAFNGAIYAAGSVNGQGRLQVLDTSGKVIQEYIDTIATAFVTVRTDAAGNAYLSGVNDESFQYAKINSALQLVWRRSLSPPHCGNSLVIDHLPDNAGGSYATSVDVDGYFGKALLTYKFDSGGELSAIGSKNVSISVGAGAIIAIASVDASGNLRWASKNYLFPADPLANTPKKLKKSPMNVAVFHYSTKVVPASGQLKLSLPKKYSFKNVSSHATQSTLGAFTFAAIKAQNSNKSSPVIAEIGFSNAPFGVETLLVIQPKEKMYVHMPVYKTPAGTYTGTWTSSSSDSKYKPALTNVTATVTP